MHPRGPAVTMFHCSPVMQHSQLHSIPKVCYSCFHIYHYVDGNAEKREQSIQVPRYILILYGAKLVLSGGVLECTVVWFMQYIVVLAHVATKLQQRFPKCGRPEAESRSNHASSYNSLSWEEWAEEQETEGVWVKAREYTAKASLCITADGIQTATFREL